MDKMVRKIVFKLSFIIITIHSYSFLNKRDDVTNNSSSKQRNVKKKNDIYGVFMCPNTNFEVDIEKFLMVRLLKLERA